MADDLFAFSRDSIARIWRVVTAVERYLLARGAGDSSGQRSRRLPRTYRRFTLTAQLVAGGTAAVEWDDGTTGEVTDPDTCCWGLEGETGEAAAFPTSAGDGIEWQVTKNPGQAGYYGTFVADTTASPCNVSIDIDGDSRTVSCVLRRLPGSGKKYASGAGCYVTHFRGEFAIMSVLDCAVST